VTRAILVSGGCLVGAALIAAGVMVLLGGDGHVARETAQLAAASGLLLLVVVHLYARTRATGSFRLQFAVSVAGVAVLALGVVLWSARQMFVSESDAAVLGSLMAFAAIIGVRAATILAERSARDVEQLRAGLERIESGDLDHRIVPQGAAELRALAEAANEMAAALRAAGDERARSDGARRSLVAAVSHDLRTPLASLRLLVDGLRDGVIEPAAVDEALERMDHHLRALGTLVDDLFELARIDAGDTVWDMHAVGVDELVDETVEAFRPQAARQGLELVDDVEDAGLAVHANPDRLQRVLANLLQNAIRHTSQARTVTVRAQAAPERFVLFEVADDGVGLSGDDAECAFERFWRGGRGASRPSGDGAGLGLPICRAIVEAHGGRIWIEPGGAGTRVRFLVPVG
jgi:signal transduction histidine kinase